MSLIQDALKRKSEEAGLSAQPAVPTLSVTDPAPSGKGPKLLLIMLVMLLLSGALAALVGLSLYLIKPKTALPKPPVATVSAPKPVAAPEAPVQGVKPIAVSAVAEPVISKKEPVPEITRVWPDLALTGIAQSDGQNFAVLNGKILSAGRKVGDVTLIEVNAGNIVVEYFGERRTLYIDE